MEKIFAEIKKASESIVSFGVLCALGIIIIALVSFVTGVAVGYRKASFARSWGEHYMENFGILPARALLGPALIPGGNYFPSAHGAAGKIMKIELPKIILQDKDNTEKVISIDDGTIMQKGRIGIAGSDLKIDDFIVTIGAPDDQGIIKAKLIRVIPRPEFLK